MNYFSLSEFSCSFFQVCQHCCLFAAFPAIGLQSHWSCGVFCMQKRATSNTTLGFLNYQLAFDSSQGIKFVFPLISLGYAIDQRCFKLSELRIGELFASYITLYKHSHLSERLLKRRVPEQWKTGNFLLPLLVGHRLFFSLCPLAVFPWQNCSNNFSSPGFGWPDSIAPHLCCRAGLMLLKHVKEGMWMAPVFPTRIKSLAINEFWEAVFDDLLEKQNVVQ